MSITYEDIKFRLEPPLDCSELSDSRGEYFYSRLLVNYENADLSGCVLLRCYPRGIRNAIEVLPAQSESEVTLRGADLRGANFSNAILSEIDFEGSNLEGANLANARLLYANFENANLKDVYFNGADLTEACLVGANLDGANMNRVNLTGASLENASLRGSDLSVAMLHKTSLRGADLTGAKLDVAYIEDADFEGADLSRANLLAVDFRQNRNLEKANFEGALAHDRRFVKYGAYWLGDGSNFEGADLSGRELYGECFTSANLKDADLRNANLNHASFWKADLRGADFRGANLEDATFREADCRGAMYSKTTNMRGVSITTEQLNSMILVADE